MIRVSTREAREHLTTTLDQVAQGERVVVEHGGRDVGAFVSMEDLAVLSDLEDRVDRAAVEEALGESEERIPYEEIRRELGLDEP